MGAHGVVCFTVLFVCTGTVASCAGYPTQIPTETVKRTEQTVGRWMGLLAALTETMQKT